MLLRALGIVSCDCYSWNLGLCGIRKWKEAQFGGAGLLEMESRRQVEIAQGHRISRWACCFYRTFISCDALLSA